MSLPVSDKAWRVVIVDKSTGAVIQSFGNFENKNDAYNFAREQNERFERNRENVKAIPQRPLY